MKKYILHYDDKVEFNAGSKATGDCEQKLMERGYERIRIKKYASKVAIIAKIKNVLRDCALFQIKRKSLVVIQHPHYTKRMYMEMLRFIKSFKKLKYVFIIHDLESLRKIFKENAERFAKNDDMMYEIADVIIVHNKIMADYLTETQGVDKNKIVILDIFDYLLDQNVQAPEDHSKDSGVIIAGNLNQNKCGYVYQLAALHSKTVFQLYGLNFTLKESEDKNWNYYGAFSPEELILHMKGAYGLVWDGNQLDTCNGASGEYMRYNNPHKVSLYIACQKPIIIWSKAALAGFIVEHGIGIAIDDLNQIDEALGKVTQEEYDRMKQNIKELSQRVRAGHYINTAIDSAEKKLGIQ